MSEKQSFVLDVTKSAQEQFRSLVLHTKQGFDVNAMTLGKPVSIEDESGNNTQITAKVTIGDKHQNYLMKYNRLSPVQGNVKVAIKINKETDFAKVEKQFNDIGIDLNEVIVKASFVTQSTETQTEITATHQTREDFESAFSDYYRYADKFTVTAKDTSLTFVGSSDVLVLNEMGTVSLTGFTPESIDNDASALTNFLNMATASGYVGNHVIQTNIKAINDITDVEPFEETNNSNTIATIVHELPNGAYAQDVVSWNRVSLDDLTFNKTLIITEEELASGYAGVFEFINKHLAEHLVENTQSDSLTSDAVSSEVELLNINSVDDLIPEIRQTGSITLKAKDNSLVYKGRTSITITTQPTEMELNGFSENRPIPENYKVAENKPLNEAIKVTRVTHEGDLRVTGIEITSDVNVDVNLNITVPSLWMNVNAGSLSVTKGTKFYPMNVSVWTGGADVVLVFSKDGEVYNFQFSPGESATSGAFEGGENGSGSIGD